MIRHVRSRARPLFAAVVALLAPALALAHTGHEGGSTGFAAGFLHPLTGVDHLLAMLAVGLWAAQLRGRAVWLLPALFPAVMAAGAGLALASGALPGVELLIALSVIVLGAAVTLGAGPPLAASAALVGCFALVHGHAHGAEFPAGGSFAAYAAGFVGATFALHLTGLALGILGQRWSSGRISRLGGSAIAVSGLALLLA